jgi:predicted  nucleic acid-binding Zn-ribbon protein
LPDGYLVRVEIAKGKSEGNLKVVEQTPSTTTISIWDYRALDLLEALVISTDLTPDMRTKVQPVVDLRREIGRIDTEIDGLKAQQIELDQRANETRENLEAIKKDSAANSLRKKLSDRLDDFTRDGDKLGRRIVELQSQRLEKKIALEDLLDGLDLSAPPSKPAKKADAKPAK